MSRLALWILIFTNTGTAVAQGIPPSDAQAVTMAAKSVARLAIHSKSNPTWRRPGAIATTDGTARRLNAYGSVTCAGSTAQKRSQPTMDVIPAATGQPVSLSVINVNCGKSSRNGVSDGGTGGTDHYAKR